MSITPIRDMHQLPEHGRIRTGEKVPGGQGKRASMRSLDTFRLTTIDRDALEQLAAIYGGTVVKWHDPSANPPNQWQLTTTSDTLSVLCQPGGADCWYEDWTGGSLQRRCDAVTCTVWTYHRDGQDTADEPCICLAQGVRECRPKTRANLIFPDIDFAGTWRYESSGEEAMRTIPSMMALIDALSTEAGLLPVDMVITDRARTKGAQKKKWRVVQFRTKVTVAEIMSGQGSYQAQLIGGRVTSAPSLNAGTETPVSVPSASGTRIADTDVYHEAGVDDDDDIAEAEIIDDDGDTIMTKSEAMAQAKAKGTSIRKAGAGWVVT